MFEQIIDDLIIKTREKNLKLNHILSDLFNDDELKQKYTNEIRRSTIIGQIANKVIKKSKIKQECKIMAIGDIAYFGKNKKIRSKLVKKSLNSIDIEKIEGYDLSGQGSLELRETLYSYMDNYYNYSNLDKELVIDSIIPTYGCTDGFVSLLDTLKNSYKKIKFIYPEASFIANIRIAEQTLGKSKTIKLDKPKADNFFLSEEQIDDIYDKKTSSNNTNIYYITPVGNPTGSKISDLQFMKIIKKILLKDKNAIFILDNVYIPLLKEKISTKMFKDIFNSKDILDRIIFTESLSKALGATGLRIGWVWTTNEQFSKALKRNIILKKAGFSKILDQFTISLLSKNKKIIKFQNKTFKFWSKQRENFYAFIKKNHKGLFIFSSSCNFCDREGIYLLLKIRDGYTKEDIFSKTGIIGVGIELSDGLYIRYAFGNVDYY